MADARATNADARARATDAPAVLHLDIDAFFASVEQARDPRLAGRPVIVGNGVIASCSYEARRFGLRAGMSLVEARRLCPRAVILDGHEPTYRAFASRIWALLTEVTPDLDTYLDEAYGDVSGVVRLHGDLVARCRTLQQAIADQTGGVPVTIGLGPNRMLAKLVGKTVKPRGLAALSAAEADAFLAERPASDVPGVGPAVARRLADFGVITVTDLRRLSREVLAAVFGAVGPVLYDRARGRDTRAVHVREIPQTISRETAFHRATADPVEVGAMLDYLTERACRATRALGLVPRTIGVRLRYADGVSAEGQRTPADPSALDPAVHEVTRALLAKLWARRVVLSHVGVVLSKFVPDGAAQLDLISSVAQDKTHRLVEGLDDVRDRYGHAALVSGRSLHLLGRLAQTRSGFVLRTPSLTK
jgi:DNA polymerase-4